MDMQCAWMCTGGDHWRVLPLFMSSFWDSCSVYMYSRTFIIWAPVYYRLKFHHKNVNLDAVSEFVSSWFTNSNQRHVLIGSKYSNRAVSCTVQISRFKVLLCTAESLSRWILPTCNCWYFVPHMSFVNDIPIVKCMNLFSVSFHPFNALHVYLLQLQKPLLHP